MKKLTPSLDSFFKVLHSTSDGQLAEMTLAPGSSTGGPDNSHSSSDQWLYVVEGKGKAIVGNKTINFKTGDLLLIEKGETHEIKNASDNSLKTLNFYTPPAY